MLWKTSWSYAQRGTSFTFWKQTSFIHTFRNNLCGKACRVKYSNWYGKSSCELARVKLYIKGVEYILLHNGKEVFSISPYKDRYSDILNVEMEPCEITVEVIFTSLKRPESGNTFRPGVVMILQSLEVLSEEDADVVALFGDSITHWGNWANPLISKIYTENKGRVAMFELGINGSRLLNGSPSDQLDGLGYSGIKRFGHDVLEVEGISCCVFALGLNDLATPEEERDVHLSFESYVAAASEIIRQAHERNIKMVGLTICPRTFDSVYTEQKNLLRKRINAWILQDAPFDRSVDVAALVTNETDNALKEEYDSGDGVHINEAAGVKIAEMLAAEMFRDGGLERKLTDVNRG